MSRLKGLEEFNGDFLNLEDSKERFFEFYSQDFYKSCDYCRDYGEPAKQIAVAVQTDKVLKLEKD